MMIIIIMIIGTGHGNDNPFGLLKVRRTEQWTSYYYYEYSSRAHWH